MIILLVEYVDYYGMNVSAHDEIHKPARKQKVSVHKKYRAKKIDMFFVQV